MTLIGEPTATPARPDVTLEVRGVAAEGLRGLRARSAAGRTGSAGVGHDPLLPRRCAGELGSATIDLTMGAGEIAVTTLGPGADRDQAGGVAGHGAARAGPVRDIKRLQLDAEGFSLGRSGTMAMVDGDRRRERHARREAAGRRARCSSSGRPRSPATRATGSPPTSRQGQLVGAELPDRRAWCAAGPAEARRHVHLPRRAGPLSRHHAPSRRASPAAPRSPATACRSSSRPARTGEVDLTQGTVTLTNLIGDAMTPAARSRPTSAPPSRRRCVCWTPSPWRWARAPASAADRASGEPGDQPRARACLCSTRSRPRKIRYKATSPAQRPRARARSSPATTSPPSRLAWWPSRRASRPTGDARAQRRAADRGLRENTPPVKGVNRTRQGRGRLTPRAPGRSASSGRRRSVGTSASTPRSSRAGTRCARSMLALDLRTRLGRDSRAR